MTPAPPLDEAARISVRRLIDLLQVLVPTRPRVVEKIEQCAVALVVDDVRQQIVERLQRFDAEDLATVEALTVHLDLKRRQNGNGHGKGSDDR